MGPEAGPAPADALAGRDARRPPRRRERRPALERRGQAAHPRQSRELGTRNLVAGLRAADPRPGVLVSASAVGYYGPHGDERVDEDTPAGRRLPRRGLRGLGARGATRPRTLGVRVVQRPHRRRARQGAAARWRRCCRSSGSASAGRWRAATSTCRGSTSTTSSASTCRARRRAPGRARSTPPRPSPSPTRSSRRRSAARCTARRSRPCPGFAVRAALRRDGRDRHRRASARSRSARATLGFSFRHPDLDEALRSALRLTADALSWRRAGDLVAGRRAAVFQTGRRSSAPGHRRARRHEPLERREDRQARCRRPGRSSP